MELKDKTIFVSLACIGYDTELERTIKSCFDNAVNPERVQIGLNLVYSPVISPEKPDYILDYKKMLKDFPNVRYVINLVQPPASVTRDRNGAADLYLDEDYILQTDSHCYFMPNWDAELIECFEEAKVLVDNERTILTATLPKYNLEENALTDVVIPEKTPFGFGFWENDFVEIGLYPSRRVPAWAHSFPEFISSKLHKRLEEKKFAPIPKITGAFMFGNKNLAKHIKAPDWIIFWEEEVVLSIELIDAGFTLVYPYIFAPIYHYYQIDETNTGKGSRAGIGDIIIATAFDNESIAISEENREKLTEAAQWLTDFDNEEIERLAHEWRSEINKSFDRYINDPKNKKKIRFFEKYSGISFKTAKSKTEFPPYYCNVGKYPVSKNQD